MLKKEVITDKKGALIPLTSSNLTPPYADRISRCPATSRAHFRAENCSPKLCLLRGIYRRVDHSGHEELKLSHESTAADDTSETLFIPFIFFPISIT